MRILLVGSVLFLLAPTPLFLQGSPTDSAIPEAAVFELPPPPPPPFPEYREVARWVDWAERNEGYQGWSPDTPQEWHRYNMSRHGPVVEGKILGSEGRYHTYYFRFSPDGKIKRVMLMSPEDIGADIYPNYRKKELGVNIRQAKVKPPKEI